ncbi:MAG: DUF2905 domain-containing protein [Burkholderiales bacterium]
MLRWLLVVFIALVVMNAAAPYLAKWLGKLGLGRMPGDFHFRFRGREWAIPLGSTVLVSLFATLIARLL